MRFHPLKTAIWLPLLSLVLAQDPTPTPSASSSSPSSSASGASNSSASVSANQTVLTTVVTSFIPQGSGSSSPLPMTFTLTLNSTSPALNESMPVGGNATIHSNGTITNSSESTNETVVWKEGDDWVPFNIVIDPAYGVLGALLIISGIPLAILGGKNRWSSLAIATGYALMLFTLVLILSLGVSPALQPPSPKPPTQLLRGLYLLACILTACIGAGIGIFLYKLAKYWVSAAGGFAFGWYLLALRAGGTITNVIGRWGLLGGLAVGAFVANLPDKLNPWMILIATSWIGATAFILGVDCFTRAGLKEFYVYNLGFWNLFPKLEGAKYPLTQTMAIELGIMAAVFLIGAAIQFRILNILQKRMKQMREEEEARIDAQEVGKAAERFKNLEAEQQEWEEKYGNDSNGRAGSSSNADTFTTPNSPGAADLPQLEFSRESRDKRFSSTQSLLSQKEIKQYEPIGQISPTLDTFPLQRRSRSQLGMVDTSGSGKEELAGDVPSPKEGETLESKVLEDQMKLLDEVKKARLEIRSSLDKLRSQTPTLSVAGRDGTGSGGSTPTTERFESHTRRVSGASSRVLDGRPVSILQRNSPTSSLFPSQPQLQQQQARPQSQLQTPKSEWDQYVSAREIVSPHHASGSLPPTAMMNRQSSYELGVLSREDRMGGQRASMMEGTFPPASREPYTRRGSSQTMPRPMTNYELLRPTSTHDLAGAGAGAPAGQSGSNRLSSYGPGMVIGSAAGSRSSVGPGPGPGTTAGFGAAIPRAMTYEELSERHRKRLTKLQDPVSSKMNEEIQLEEAKKKWEKQKKAERDEMRKREAEKLARVREREKEAEEQGRSVDVSKGTGAGSGRGKREVMKSTDEWRRSVAGGLDGMVGPGTGSGSGSGSGSAPQGYHQQQQYGSKGKRRMSSHMAN